MAVDVISECFRDYVDTEWHVANYTKPSVIAVMSTTDSPGKFKGAQSSAILIGRGEIGFIPVDLGASDTVGGFRVRQWRTNVFCYETSSVNLQGLMDEFLRIVSKWQSTGGGAFSASDSDKLAYVQDLIQIVHTSRSADINIIFNGYYEQADLTEA